MNILLRRNLSAVLVLAFCLVDSGLAQWLKEGTPAFNVPVATWAVAAKGDTLFVGTHKPGGSDEVTIYRSTDNGVHWTPRVNGISSTFVPGDFFITGDTIFAMGGGIFRSTDFGDSWQSKNNGFLELPYGNSIPVFAMARSGNFLFAGTSFGVYRSSNNGDNWYPSNGSEAYWEVLTLAVSDGGLFAGSNETGIFRSINNGTTWHPVNAGLPPNTWGGIVRVVRVLDDGANLYVGTAGRGVYRSSNYGNLWLPETTGFGQANNGFLVSVSSFAKVGSVLYAGTLEDGIYRLPSPGGTWSKIESGMPSDAYVTSMFVTQTQILATAYRIALFHSSLSDSLAWSPLFSEYPGNVYSTKIGSSGDNLLLSAQSEYYNGTFYRTFLSSNSGTTWSPDSSLGNRYFSSFQSYGDSVYAVGDGLFLSTDSGISWTENDSSLYNLQTFIKIHDTLYAGWGYDSWQWGEYGELFASTNNGVSWNNILPGNKAAYAVAKIGNNLFVGGQTGVIRTTDEGLHWTGVNNGLPSPLQVECFATVGENLFIGAWNGVYRSSDYGDSWTSVSNGLPIDTSVYHVRIKLLAHDNQLIAGTTQGVFVSVSMGSEWTSLNQGLEGDALFIISLTMKGDRLFVTTLDGVWGSPQAELDSVRDAVVRVSAGWNIVSIPVLVSDPSKSALFPTAVSPAFGFDSAYSTKGTLACGAAYWIKFSEDQSVAMSGFSLVEGPIAVRKGWNMIGPLSQPVAVASITSNPAGIVTSQFFGYRGLYAAHDTLFPGVGYWVKSNEDGTFLFSAGSLTQPLARIVIRPTIERPPSPPDGNATDPELVPATYDLHQNYPNPFNPSTTIRYELASQSHVSLTIFDMLGKEIAVLVDEIQEPGYKTVNFGAKGLSSGVYYYRLKAGSFVATRKLLLIK